MRNRLSDAGDLSDREWEILDPLLPAEKPGGRLNAGEGSFRTRHSVLIQRLDL